MPASQRSYSVEKGGRPEKKPETYYGRELKWIPDENGMAYHFAGRSDRPLHSEKDQLLSINEQIIMAEEHVIDIWKLSLSFTMIIHRIVGDLNNISGEICWVVFCKVSGAMSVASWSDWEIDFRVHADKKSQRLPT